MGKEKSKPVLLTVREVAKMLGALESSVRIWARRGRFPGAYVVKPPVGVPYWQIPADSVTEFRKEKPGPKPKLKPRPMSRQAPHAASQTKDSF